MKVNMHLVRLGISGLFLIMFVSGIVLTVSALSDYNSAENEYTELQAVTSESTDDKPTEVVEESFSSTRYDVPDFSVDFDELMATNEDCVAWIHIPAIEIDYPVVRSHDNQEYLKLTFNKKKNSSGCIFTDCRIDVPFKQRTLVYGHNMKTGTMFASLYRLEGMEDFSNVPIWIYLPDGTIQRYEIQQVTRVDAYDTVTYSLDSDATEIVLSTCVKDDLRLVVIAKKAATYI